MPNRYKVALKETGRSDVWGSLIRDSVQLETKALPEQTVPGTYEADSDLTWQEYDDILFWFGEPPPGGSGLIEGSYTYQPEYKNRWNSK
jgi:hypothetical protein